MSTVIKANYEDEAVKGFTHRTAIEEAARCLLCYDAPCSKSCPAGTDPAKFIRSIRFRNAKGAAETIRENNILGGTCARVCPYDRLCEKACSRTGIDRPINIGQLQRYAIEQEEAFNMQTLKVTGDKKNKSIACVGAGPASLAVAAELAKNGYDVTIFEKEAKAGGILRYGISPSRLPEHVVDHDIKQVENLGVKFEFNTVINGFEKLKGFDAIFLGVGLSKGSIPKVEGNDLERVYSASDFLRSARIEKEKFNVGKKVVIIGGGDVAVDCSVTAKLLGAEDVKIVYRRTLEEAPANMNELHYALDLGVGVTTNMSPEKIIGNKSVEAVQFKGRDETSSLILSADTVIFAVGQKADNLNPFGLYLNDKGLIVAKNGETSESHIFAAGDIVHGGKTVVEAVAAGKIAAQSIMKFLERGK